MRHVFHACTEVREPPLSCRDSSISIGSASSGGHGCRVWASGRQSRPGRVSAELWVGSIITWQVSPFLIGPPHRPRPLSASMFRLSDCRYLTGQCHGCDSPAMVLVMLSREICVQCDCAFSVDCSRVECIATSPSFLHHHGDRPRASRRG